MCEPKEWTLMFYFATDNPLAISAVSQLKAIKDAGFHPDANVVAQFDPYTEGTPTHVFDVNLINKLKSPRRANIGFASDDPIVRSILCTNFSIPSPASICIRLLLPPRDSIICWRSST